MLRRVQTRKKSYLVMALSVSLSTKTIRLSHHTAHVKPAYHTSHAAQFTCTERPHDDIKLIVMETSQAPHASPSGSRPLALALPGPTSTRPR